MPHGEKPHSENMAMSPLRRHLSRTPASRRRGRRLPPLAVAAAAVLLAASLLAAILPAAPVNAAGGDEDWPCIQRLVPRISAAQVWGGPEPQPDMWAGNLDIARLASKIAVRRTPDKEAEKLVERFADKLAEDKDTAAANRALTGLFGRSLEIVNADRASLIAGIKRFARRQALLAERIRANRAKVRQGTDAETPLEDSVTLAEAIAWDQRVFDEREKSLTYLCEQPVLLEQRAFLLGRAIGYFLEE